MTRRLPEALQAVYFLDTGGERVEVTPRAIRDSLAVGPDSPAPPFLLGVCEARTGQRMRVARASGHAAAAG